MRGRKAQIVTDRKAVAYLRVSTQEQAANGSSLEAQRNRLQALAIGTERRIDDTYCDDGYSAGSLRRPALQRLLSNIRSGAISALHVTKLDRLSRSLADLLELVHLAKSTTSHL
jgi:site-specific DNA recombinase